MSLGKQAKVLTKAQAAALLNHVANGRNAHRNAVIVLLSVKAGLRAKEIANLKWDMVTDADGAIGASIHLPDIASKGSSGRIIPINGDLRTALRNLLGTAANRCASSFIVTTSRSDRTSAQAIINLFSRWYRELGFSGCSSHSGRRTFITNAARRISTVGGSLRDVQLLAGHSNLSTTQRYIEADVEAQRRIVELV
jgi:integrase/recombinase XerD